MEFPRSNLILFVHEFIPTLIALSLVVGASALWARSWRISALTQLVASAGLLLVALVENLQSFALRYSESLRVLWTSWPAEAKIAVGTVSAIVFSIAYLCHGIRSKDRSKPDEAVNSENIQRDIP